MERTISNKTEIRMTINGSYTVNNVKRVYNDETEKVSKKREQLTAFFNPQNYFDELSEMAHFYIETCSVKMAFKAIKTVYQKSPTEQMRFLYNGICNIMSNGHETEKAMINSMETESDTAKLQFAKEHEYIMVKGMDGKRHRIAKNYKTIEFTDFGKSFMTLYDESEYNPDVSAQDIVTVAKIALYELVNNGLVNSYNDLWVYREFVYKACNKAIMSERAVKANVSESYENIIVEYGESADMVIYGKRNVEKSINSLVDEIGYEQIKSSIVKCCLDNFNSRVNKETAIEIVQLYLDGHTITEIAKITNVKKPNVSRYIDYFRNVISDHMPSVCVW